MPRTPRPQTIPLDIGATYVWPVKGECLNIISISGATAVGVGFDSDSIEQLVCKSYQTRSGDPFHSLTFRNDNAVAIVVTCFVADSLVSDTNRDQFAGVNAMTYVNSLVGAAAVRILTANPNRKKYNLYQSPANVGSTFYLGKDNTVTDVVGTYFSYLGAGDTEFGQPPIYNGEIWAYCVSANPNQRILGYEL